MFEFLMFVGIILLVVAAFVAFELKSKVNGATLAIIGIVMIIFACTTPQGKIHLNQFTSSGSGGSWLVVDNSGGKTMRHWIILDGYVKSSENSDGWQFVDENNNLVYVSGDSFVMQIKQDLDEFRKDYRALYAIPEGQHALK